MHRTKHMPRFAFGLVLLALGLGNLTTGLTPAQEVAPPPNAQGPAAQNVLVVPIGVTKTLQMKGKRNIGTVVNQQEVVATVVPAPTPDAVLITGRQAGRTRITLTAADDAKIEEIYEIIVELDVEYIKNVLKRVAPTAVLELIPVGSAGAANSLVIKGYVDNAGDINDIIRVAESIMGGPQRVINQMTATGVQQVQLDVIIARVQRSELRQMNFDFWNAGAQHDLAFMTGRSFQVPTGIEQSAGALTLTNTFPAAPFANINGAPPNVYLGLYNDRQQLFSFLQILRTESLGKLLAEPKLVTSSGKAASFQDGGTFFLPATGGQIAAAPQPVDFGTRLTFMPVVMGNGKIYLEVEPDVSTIGAPISGNVSLLRQRVRTVVEIDDGQTLVIGGMIQNVLQGTTTKVPVLGDLPFIGAAFSAKSFQETETELVVLVTPHLVDPLACNQLPKVLPGQETRSPDDFELFMEGILEAPRGQREVKPNRRYVPAYKHSPSANQYPCGGNGVPCGQAGTNACGPKGCAGSGLAEAAPVGYPGGTPAAVDVRPAAPVEAGNNAALLPPIEGTEGGAAPAGNGKSPSLFGPAGYQRQ